MVRKFVVVALVAATSFVSWSSDSEASYRRRARLAANRNCVSAPAPVSYASSPVMGDCGCSSSTMGNTGYSHQGNYNGNLNSHYGVGANLGGSSVYGNAGTYGNGQMIGY